MSRHSTAHHFLQGLVDLGVEYIFANLGTDHVSLIEEMARWDSEGLKHPEMILCPHEVVAVHMAGGYALATGRCTANCRARATPMCISCRTRSTSPASSGPMSNGNIHCPPASW